uniref:NADPH oxidase respiratory burst oxidase-like protein n=1 Tax=Gracilariopsis lemaneiformis TaxID=2782 RepID=A0A451EE70_GRALE|nr:NADPH oxidase respiratory burst oxidase-like protein [Gracilariopsis lemaneiformis]
MADQPVQEQPAADTPEFHKHVSAGKRVTRFFANVEANLSTYALLYLFLIFYFAVNVLMFLWGFHGEIVYQPNIDQGSVMRYIIGVARGAGYTLNINTAFVILLAARLLFTKLRDTPVANVLPLDKAFPMLHIIVGYVIASSVLIHATFHFGWLFGFGGWVWGLWGFNMSVITGALLIIVFATMLWFLRPSVRKKNFPLFYRVHIIGAILFFTLLIFHGMYRLRPETYKYIVPTLIIYITDRVLRRLHVSTTTLQLSSSNSFFKDDNVLELRVPKPFSYRAGQYAELQVPSLNREWHPFTIASAPHEETLALYIKKLGDWTGALHQEFAKRLNGEEDGPISVLVRGPYGAPCQHVQGYERVVLISGGIGATPFSAVCKQLHHLNPDGHDDHADMKHAVTVNPVDMKRVEDRMYKAISELYDVNVDAAISQVSAVDQQRSAFVTGMLQLAALNRDQSEGRMSSTDDSSTDAEENVQNPAYATSADSFYEGEHGRDNITGHSRKKQFHKDDDIFVSSMRALPSARQKMINLLDSRSHVLSFLHSTRVQFLLLVTLIARIMVISIASIWDSDFVSVLNENAGTEGFWVVIVDTILSAIVTIIIPLTVALEIFVMGKKFFNGTRWLDFFVLVPAAITTTALNIRTWVIREPLQNEVVGLNYVVFLPVIFVLLLTRLHGTLGGRRLTDTSKRCTCHLHSKAPEVDFVWTTPKADSDLWLRQELEPLASGTKLRLHRYVTREKELDEEMGVGDEFISDTNLGRPDWDHVFSDVVSRSKSDTTVGVFFCGPHKMGDAIQRSLRKIEIVSALKGAYLRGLDISTVSKDVGVGKKVVKKLEDYGCSVRFAFREENFG